ncbi:hypothetical protein KKC44_00155, partial [Patescibacteria group bacterium]|nr:hypothetical protein [Patescibacteria group bacterium]
PVLQGIAIAGVLLSTLSIVGPRSLMLNPNLYYLYQEEGYWNTHADTLNRILKDEEEVVALGPAGHHIRWYIEPRVLVGDTMDIEGRSGNYLLLLAEEAKRMAGAQVLYTDEKVSILKQR